MQEFAINIKIEGLKTELNSLKTKPKYFRHVAGLKNNSFNAIKVFKTSNVTRSQLNGKHNTKIKHCLWVADRRLTRRSVLNNLKLEE